MCLTREIELDNVRLTVRDWPGIDGPLVHTPDPVAPSAWIELIADRLTPRYRVLSVTPRPATPYQVVAMDLAGVLEQFGFETPILVAEGIGCVAALLISVWYPGRVSGLALVAPRCRADGDALEARALRQCPPDLEALRAQANVPLVEATSVEGIEAFVASLL